jgi:hypothetical protein
LRRNSDEERLLEIDNVHSEECGSPPLLDAKDKYLGYFENCCGEQWVFIGDRKTGEAVVRGGDAGWAREYKVSAKRPFPSDLILQEAERLWISSCLQAMFNICLGPTICIDRTGDSRPPSRSAI